MKAAEVITLIFMSAISVFVLLQILSPLLRYIAFHFLKKDMIRKMNHAYIGTQMQEQILEAFGLKDPRLLDPKDEIIASLEHELKSMHTTLCEVEKQKEELRERDRYKGKYNVIIKDDCYTFAAQSGDKLITLTKDDIDKLINGGKIV